MGIVMHFIKAKSLLLAVALLWAFFIVICLPVQLPITIARLIVNNARLTRYVWGFWIWQDQAVNAILGGNPDVTVSKSGDYLAQVPRGYKELLVDNYYGVIA